MRETYQVRQIKVEGEWCVMVRVEEQCEMTGDWMTKACYTFNDKRELLGPVGLNVPRYERARQHVFGA